MLALAAKAQAIVLAINVSYVKVSSDNTGLLRTAKLTLLSEM